MGSRIKQFGFVSLVLIGMTMPGCAVNPIVQAQTVGQKGYAAYGSFVIAEEKIAKLTDPAAPGLTNQQKQNLIVAVQKAHPIVDSTLDALSKAEIARADFEAQKIDKTAFEVIVNNLNSWVEQASQVVASVLASLRGVGQ